MFLRLKWPEWLALILLIAIAGFQLFVPPVIGIADNGDYSRTYAWFHLRLPELSGEEAYFRYINLKYLFDPSIPAVGLVTSQSIPLALAVQMNGAVRGWHDFDLRMLGAVYLAMLAAIVYGLFGATQSFKPAARYTLLAGCVLVLGDAGYICWFNSFYSEPASHLYFLACLAATLAVVERPSRGRVITCATVFVLFAAAKPQNVVPAAMLAIFVTRIALTRQSKVLRITAIAAALAALTASAIYYRMFPAGMVRVSHYIGVFKGILVDSPNPTADLAEFGIPPEYAKYVGTAPFDPAIPIASDAFRRDFYNHVSMPRIAAFYLRHPSRLGANLNRVARRALLLRVPWGNYERTSGKPPFAQAEAFSYWSSFRLFFIPRTLIGIVIWASLALGGAAVVWMKRPATRLYAELYAIVVLIGLSQYVVVTIAQSTFEDTKHLFLFSFTFDASLIAAAAVLSQWLARQFRFNAS